MSSICIPHSALPGTSTLFGDYLYRFDRVAAYYAHDPHDPDSIRRAASAAAAMPADRRQAIAEALKLSNGASPAIEKLARPGTVAIVTGQQVGLFSGPCYTVYKALTVARLAAQLSAEGIPAVPVFWLASEDHDFAEVNHVWVHNAAVEPVRLEARGAGQPAQPVGTIPIADLPLDALRAALADLPYGDEVSALVADAYQPGRTFGAAFRLLLEKLLAPYGFLFLDPLEPAIRQLAAPLLADAFERQAELQAALLERGRQLSAGGHHAQVLVDGSTSLFFRLEDGRRRKLTTGEGLGDASTLSPNALLRPVMQDWLLPTAAYVGGPAEIAYFAQSEVLFRSLLGRMPLALPRSGFTLMDGRSVRLMERYDLGFGDCLQGRAHLGRRISEQLVPPELAGAFSQTAGDIGAALNRLEAGLEAFDPTLAAALRRSRTRIEWQIEKNRAKAAREALRRETRVEQGARRLADLVLPEHHLQERLYSILPFLAQYGLDLISTLHDHVQQGCPDHLLLQL